MHPERSVRQADPDLGSGVTVAQIADHLDTAILGDLTAGSTVVRDIDATFRRHGVTCCAMEVSSHAIDQGRGDGTAFRVMAFTNLSDNHLDYHESMEGYFATKAAMFTPERTQIAVVDIDDHWGVRLAAGTTTETWTCSTRRTDADVVATDIRAGRLGAEFTVHTPHGRSRVGLQVLGLHQVGNALLALTAVVADGVDLAAAAEGVSSVTGIAGRCEPVHAGQPYRAIVDYMHNTAGQHAMFPYLRSLTEDGRLIVVVGATGGRDPGKREPLGQVAARYADVVIVTDESPEDEDPGEIRASVLRGAHREASAVVIEEPDRRSAFSTATSRPVTATWS